MNVKVLFRFNKLTGEVEQFEVVDEGPMRLSEAEHNREHDRIAADVGRVIERYPYVTEFIPGTSGPQTGTVTAPPGEEQIPDAPETVEEKEKQTN